MNNSDTTAATRNENFVLNNTIFISEAARILALCPETLRKLEKNGRLRTVKIGRGVRLFDREDVERLARERSTPPGHAGEAA